MCGRAEILAGHAVDKFHPRARPGVPAAHWKIPLLEKRRFGDSGPGY